VVLRVSAEGVVAALSPGGGLVLVATNREAASRSVAFDLSAFPRLTGWAQWTSTTEEENHKSQGQVPLRDGILAVDLAPRSVNTLLVEARP
jgi:hypothetical protein